MRRAIEASKKPGNERSPDKVGKSVNRHVGLKNPGNLCYFNASIQCLSNTYELSHYFLAGKHRRLLDGRVYSKATGFVLGTKGEFPEAWA